MYVSVVFAEINNLFINFKFYPILPIYIFFYTVNINLDQGWILRSSEYNTEIRRKTTTTYSVKKTTQEVKMEKIRVLIKCQDEKTKALFLPCEIPLKGGELLLLNSNHIRDG